MPRPRGSLNADFSASRSTLLNRLRKVVVGIDPPSSLRGLALASDVSVPTLRHYFGDKDAVFTAVFEDCRSGAVVELQTAATPSGPFETSVRDLVEHVAEGFRWGGLARLHAVGLIEGLAAPTVGGAYLSNVLEPTIAAAQMRLQAHIDRGEMQAVCARHAAISLVAPIVLLFLHQMGLNGARTYPTDVGAFLTAHADGFILGYGT